MGDAVNGQSEIGAGQVEHGTDRRSDERTFSIRQEKGEDDQSAVQHSGTDAAWKIEIQAEQTDTEADDDRQQVSVGVKGYDMTLASLNNTLELMANSRYCEHPLGLWKTLCLLIPWKYHATSFLVLCGSPDRHAAETI